MRRKRKNKIKIIGFIEKMESKRFFISLLFRTVRGHYFELKIKQKKRGLRDLSHEIGKIIAQKQKIRFDGHYIVPIPGPIRRGMMA